MPGIPDHKRRHHIAMDGEVWSQLFRLARASGRTPGQELETICARYFAALEAGKRLAPDATDVEVWPLASAMSR